MTPIARAAADKLEEDFLGLERGAMAFLDQEESLLQKVYADRWADVRYIGQSHEVLVPVKSGRIDVEAIYADFEQLHERLYGTRLSDPAEIVNIGVTVTGQVSRLNATPFRPSAVQTEPIGMRQTAFFEDPLPILWRDGLPPGWRHDGPCLIEEVDSVVYIPGGTVTIDEFGNVCLEWGMT